MSDTLALLGERLREERLKLALNQDGLASKIGISKNSLGAYERGQTEMKVPLLLRFQDLGIDIGYVLTGNQSLKANSAVERQILDLITHLSAREREAVCSLVSALAGKPIGDYESDSIKLGATVHSPKRYFASE